MINKDLWLRKNGCLLKMGGFWNSSRKTSVVYKCNKDGWIKVPPREEVHNNDTWLKVIMGFSTWMDSRYYQSNYDWLVAYNTMCTERTLDFCSPVRVYVPHHQLVGRIAQNNPFLCTSFGLPFQFEPPIGPEKG